LNSQGFIYADTKSRDNQPEHPDAPLPSLTLSLLAISKPEVAHVFHLPLSALTVSSRLKPQFFRDDRPYWAIAVSDLIADPSVQWESDTGKNETGGIGESLEVWGLTGWYLSLLMKVLGVYRDPR
jgi:hypothetical protein